MKGARSWQMLLPLLKGSFAVSIVILFSLFSLSLYQETRSLILNPLLTSHLTWGCNVSDTSLQALHTELKSANQELRRLHSDNSALLISLHQGQGLERGQEKRLATRLETGLADGSSAAEQAKLQDELKALHRKLDDIMAVGNTPLYPLNLQKSELHFSSKSIETGKAFVVTLKGRTIRGKEITTGGVEFYARLTGPALVAAEVKDLGTGSYEFTFLPPLEGDYALDIVLLYEHYDRSVRRWEASDFPGAAVRACMYECHDVDDESHGVAGAKAALYDKCMNVCREYSSGPALRDERRRETGFKVTGPFDYIKPDALFCGIDMPVNDDGWWVNRTLVCPEGDPSCFQNLVYCSEDEYSDSKAEVCNSVIVWRPRTCRHVYWQTKSPPPLPAVKTAHDFAQSSKDSLLFCGDSTTLEVRSVIEQRHRNLATKNIYGEGNRPKCFDEKPDVFISGGCGSNSAQVSIKRIRELTEMCKEEVPFLKAMGDQVPLIYRAGPAAFPYLGDQIVPQINPPYEIGDRFHGQRTWLTNSQMRRYNEMVRKEMVAGGVKVVEWDEFKMTFPLWDFHVDALHWGHDLAIGQTLGNTLMSHYAWIRVPGKKAS